MSPPTVCKDALRETPTPVGLRPVSEVSTSTGEVGRGRKAPGTPDGRSDPQWHARSTSGQSPRTPTRGSSSLRRTVDKWERRRPVAEQGRTTVSWDYTRLTTLTLPCVAPEPSLGTTPTPTGRTPVVRPRTRTDVRGRPKKRAGGPSRRGTTSHLRRGVRDPNSLPLPLRLCVTHPRAHGDLHRFKSGSGPVRFRSSRVGGEVTAGKVPSEPPSR